MPSPVLPSDFCELAPSPTTPPCDSLKRLFFDYPNLLCEFFGWMFNADGTITEAFKRELNAVPAGFHMFFGGLVAPSGWLFEGGGAYKQADYPYLYNAIGTRFGSGNGIDEFQVPNIGRRVVLGVDPTSSAYSLSATGGLEDVTLAESEMPPHSHLIGVEGSGISGDETTGRLRVGAGTEVSWQTTIDTTRYGETLETGGGEAHTNMMPFIVLTPCIKT